MIFWQFIPQIIRENLILVHKINCFAPENDYTKKVFRSEQTSTRAEYHKDKYYAQANHKEE
jgi:hypothetical protein